MLLIIDEVQAGLGRTGRWFAFEHEGIRPDGADPGQGAGRRAAAGQRFLADARVMDVFDPGSHGSTFGGNALAAAVALEALRVIEDENLVARSAALGDYLMRALLRGGAGRPAADPRGARARPVDRRGHRSGACHARVNWWSGWRRTACCPRKRMKR